MPAAVIMRYSRGGRQDDVLLARGQVPPHHRDLALADPFAALLAAVMQLRGATFVHNELLDLLARQRTASPLGDHGGRQVPIDQAATLEKAAATPQGKI